MKLQNGKKRCSVCSLRSELSRIRLPYLIGGAVIVLLGGFCSSLCGSGTMMFRRMFETPSFTPPGFLFPIVWTVLYLLIGAAAGSALSIREPCAGDDKTRGILLFAVMIIFNYVWYPLFFCSFSFFAALIDIAAMIVLTYFIFIYFRRFCRICALAFIPYFLWLVFAFILNLAVILLN